MKSTDMQPQSPPPLWERLTNMMSRWFLGASLSRALLEAFTLFGIAMLLLLLVDLDSVAFIIMQGALFAGAATLLLYALRLRLPQGKASLQLRDEIGSAMLFILPQMAISFLLDIVSGWMDGLGLGELTGNAILVGGLRFVLFGIVYSVSRVAVRILLYWNRLRRRRLLWQLTHAHLAVVSILSIPFLIPLLFIFIVRTIEANNQGWFISGLVFSLFGAVLPVLALWVIAVVAAVLLLFPPSVMVSFLVARRTTRRLETLTDATAALRQGDLSVRIPVSGEDEVAQLQSNFNAMAEKLEQALDAHRSEQERVEGLLQARRELVANVSHELRTPVATLRGYLESIGRREAELPPTVQQDLEVMTREAVRMQRLIDDLFALSRAEAGRFTLRTSPTDVAPVIRRAVESISTLAWERGRVQVVSNVEGTLPPVIADTERLEQVLSNLLHNGVRHTSPGGIVAVVAQVELRHVAIEVRDTGEGIAPDVLPHVWERFYRAGPANDGRGNGLGLAIVKELVEGMGGTVHATSRVGEGSVFAVRLPRIETT